MAQRVPRRLDPRMIQLTTTSPALTLVVLRGEGAPTVTAGGGGWTNVARPRRQALTVWQGRDPFSMTVPLLFDGGPGKRLVETDVSKLERMALPPEDGKEPPVVTLAGGVPHQDLPWVITGFDWGDSLWLPAGRYRQAVTVSLTRYVADDRLKDGTAAAKARGKTTTTTGKKTALAVTGDTLVTIAARELDDYSRWPEIASLNDIRDPSQVAAGQTVRLP